MPKIVVFGGRGFVGSHIVQEALTTGLHVVSVSRSGTPPLSKEPWIQQVEWVRGSALEPRTYEQHLQGAIAAISAVGAFGSQADMLKTNGTANVTAIEEAAKAGVPRFVYISAHIPPLPGIELVLGGYVRGKRLSEEALKKHFPAGGVALRPGVIYGNRVVSHNLTLPLQYVFQPLEGLLQSAPKAVTSLPIIGPCLVPPVSVQAVARAAVRAATDPSIAAGIMDVPEIAKYK